MLRFFGERKFNRIDFYGGSFIALTLGITGSWAALLLLLPLVVLSAVVEHRYYERW